MQPGAAALSLMHSRHDHRTAETLTHLQHQSL
jgi:hypothetical protein